MTCKRAALRSLGGCRSVQEELFDQFRKSARLVVMEVVAGLANGRTGEVRDHPRPPLHFSRDTRRRVRAMIAGGHP